MLTISCIDISAGSRARWVDFVLEPVFGDGYLVGCAIPFVDTVVLRRAEVIGGREFNGPTAQSLGVEPQGRHFRAISFASVLGTPLIEPRLLGEL